MDRESRNQAAEDALVHRRPGTWKGVGLCLVLAVVGAVLAVASHSTSGIGIGLLVLGVVCAFLGTVHLTWAQIRGTDS